MALIKPFYKSANRDFCLVQGDCSEILSNFEFKFDTIFADPPYFLSNGGVSIQSGKIVSVNKGDWDKGISDEEMYKFNKQWLLLCREKLKDNGTIWVTGTKHNIFSIERCLRDLGYKVLNIITWQKPNPPQNITKKYFTFSSEFIIWARKYENRTHFFNYELMKEQNGDHQMTDVWKLPTIGRWEKSCGKHPTQKPIPLLSRIILASTLPGGWVLDPFCGSGTTGVAASLLGRRFLGIEREAEFVEMGKSRREELNIEGMRESYLSKIEDVTTIKKVNPKLVSEPTEFYGDLPF